jgi:hypothetical protein
MQQRAIPGASVERGRFPPQPGSGKKSEGESRVMKIDVGGSNMPVRGIRGATSASANTRDAILQATRELLSEMLRANGLAGFDDIASIV